MSGFRLSDSEDDEPSQAELEAEAQFLGYESYADQIAAENPDEPEDDPEPSTALDEKRRQWVAYCRKRGLKAVFPNDNQWQAVGGVSTLNYWPSSRRFYVDGQKEAFRGTLREAFDRVTQFPFRLQGKMPKLPFIHKTKRIQLQRGRYCRCCGKPFHPREGDKGVTVDWLFCPSKDGITKGFGNLIITCEECPDKRRQRNSPLWTELKKG